MKRCLRCSETKSVHDFRKTVLTRDKLHVYCNECDKKYRDGRACSKIVQEKRCTKCGQTKHASDFGNNRTQVDGLTSSCRLCDAASRASRACSVVVSEKRCSGCRQMMRASEFYRAKGTRDGLEIYCRECSRWRDIKRNYGLSREGYENIMNSQGGVCAICQTCGSEPLVVDHDHQTGVVRELLCRLCNSILGLARENTKLLMSAANYLVKHGQQK